MQSSTPQAIPSRIGKYEIVRKIADGGMAEVFLGRIAQQTGFEKLVAIKRILPHLAEERTFIEMFLDEARIAALLNHSNITQIFDLGTAESGYFIAMEYVRGVPLSALNQHFAACKQRPAPALAAYLIANVCAGLEYAHTCCDNQGQQLNIVHRDVSPTNILISAEGTIKLIDFGIAKAAQRLQQTQAGKIKGKFGYMSPEQVRTGQIDHRSDIFSSGMVLYELLTGDNPFCGANTADSFERARRAYIPPPRSISPEIPPALEAICLRALAVQLEERYQSAREMELDLEHFRRQHPYSRLELAALIKQLFPESLSSPGAHGAGNRPAAAQLSSSPKPRPAASRPEATQPSSRPEATQPSSSPKPRPAASRPEATEISSSGNTRWSALTAQPKEQGSDLDHMETIARPRLEPTARESGRAAQAPRAFEQQRTMLLPLEDRAPANEERTIERPSPTPTPLPAYLATRQPLRYRAVVAGFAAVMILSLAGYLIWVLQRLPPDPPPSALVVEPLAEDARVSGAAERAWSDAEPAPDTRPAQPDVTVATPDSARATPNLSPDLGNWSTYHHRPGPREEQRPGGETVPDRWTRPGRDPRSAKQPPRRPRRRPPPKKLDPKTPPIPFDGL